MGQSVTAVCASCGTRNRVGLDRLHQGPVCGKCGGEILRPRPEILGPQLFDKVVGGSELPVVVDFWAPWCGPCKAMGPAFEQAAQTLHGRAVLAKVNTEQHQGLAGRFGIRSIPTLMLFRNGREAVRQAGAMDAISIASWVNGNL